MLTPIARLQVWPDEVTLTFGGAEARSRRRQGGAGGPGSPRPRPHPSAIHSSSPPPHILTCAHADQGGCCSLCDGGGQGAVPHPHGGCWEAFCNREAALSTKNMRAFACLRVVVSARGQISKSSMWSKRGKPPRLCRPYDSIRAGEALGAGAGVARASADRQTRSEVSAGSASYHR